MIVLPVTSTVRASAGIATAPRGPTAAMRLPSTTITPSLRIWSPFMVTMRAPTRAIFPSGAS